MLKILITNQKGGVGKSTISANLAHYFSAFAKKKTTLVDFDTQGSSSKWVRAVKPQIINVHNPKLPLSGGTNRILIDCRNIMRIASKRSDVVITDLTWFDVFDSEMFLEFDLVILPTAVSEVELVATMEFAERHQWVFNAKGANPSLVIVPSRVRKDQNVTFKHSTERFPFSFLLTPPVLDSIEAKKSFCKNYILNMRKHNLKESFSNFCEAIEQTAKLHVSKMTRRIKYEQISEISKISRLNSGLNYEIKKTDALMRIKKEKQDFGLLSEQLPNNEPELIELNKKGFKEEYFEVNNKINKQEFKIIENSKSISKNKEPILGVRDRSKEKKFKPIVSSSRRLLVEPPLFLKKQGS